MVEEAFFTLKRSFHMDQCSVAGPYFSEGNSHPRLELKMAKDNTIAFGNAAQCKLLMLSRGTVKQSCSNLGLKRS